MNDHQTERSGEAVQRPVDEDWRTKMLRSPLPIDRVAARVVFGRGELWQARMRPAEHTKFSAMPLPIRDFDKAVPPQIRALVGRRRDRMTLLGLAFERNKKGAWVARCDCGNYEHRSRIQRWLAIDAPDACRECRCRHYAIKGRPLGITEAEKNPVAEGQGSDDTKPSGAIAQEAG